MPAITRCVGLLALVALVGCKDDERVATYTQLMALPIAERDQKMAEMPPRQQVDLYVWAVRYYRPADLGLASSLARQGITVLPAIIDELERPEAAAITSELLLVVRTMVIEYHVDDARLPSARTKSWCDRFYEPGAYCYQLANDIRR